MLKRLSLFICMFCLGVGAIAFDNTGLASDIDDTTYATAPAPDIGLCDVDIGDKDPVPVGMDVYLTPSHIGYASMFTNLGQDRLDSLDGHHIEHAVNPIAANSLWQEDTMVCDIVADPLLYLRETTSMATTNMFYQQRLVEMLC